ncbi:MAG: matrixin family metalloprotease [Sandaracinus sp.]|nr:matrixin family metalloprotease [Sandaracinus sp.]
MQDVFAVEEGRFVVDKDILVPSPAAAREYLEREIAWANVRAHLATQGDDEVGAGNAALTQFTPGDLPSMWEFPANTRLTYCIDERSFGSRAGELVAALHSAMESWSRVANVRFERKWLDSCDKRSDEVVFNVRRLRDDNFVALAFFPTDERRDREFLVSNDAFESERASLVGILEHELGHVLGFRHEHIWVGCGPESTGEATPLTPYDVNSVMHYPQCRPGGGGGLSLSDLDRRGVVQVYGLAPALISVI